MTRFIKIFATLAGLTLMTACGNTQGLIDALAKAVSDTDRTAPLCVQNPFNQSCDPKDGEEADAAVQRARDTIRASCTANPSTSDSCLNYIVFVCERDDPYNDICTLGGNDYSTDQARITADCIRDDTGPLCNRAVAAICTQNAFHRLCLTDLANRYDQGVLVPGGENVIGFSAKRAEACDPVTGTAPTSQQCITFVTTVCNRDPFDAVCANRDEYFVARDNFCWIQGIDGSTRTAECDEIHRVNNLQVNAERDCRANYVDPTGANRFNPRCYNVIIPICNVNPFDDICDENTNFTNKHDRYTIDCREEVTDAPYCAEAKTSVCDDNPFDRLCFLDYTSSNYPTNNDYESERDTAINDCQTNFVAGKRCLGAAEQSCRSATGEGLFASLCLNDPNTDTARQPACVDDRPTADSPITPRCATTATRICDGDPLDRLCDGVDGYFDAQLSACILKSENPSCVVGGEFQFAAIEPIAACLKTPFAAACLDINTTQGELFAPRAEAAQDAYCESGGARTASTTVVTTADRVNCTNIGSSPVFADLARNITQNGVRTVSTGENPVVTNEVTPSNPNIGGFLRTGVFGTRLGNHIGLNSGDFHDETNNGNFDRGDPTGGPWTGSPAGFFPDLLRIWEGARRDNPADEDTADPNDGFTYFLVENDDLNLLAYAGIWQTTNFGAPLAAPVNQEPTSAIWAGNFTSYAGAPKLTAKPTNFYVDFTDGTFNVHNPAGTDNANPNGTAPKTGSVISEGFFGGVNEFDDYVSSNFIYTVNGIFGTDKNDPNVSHTNGGVARTLNPGELSGSVTLVNNTFPSKLASDGDNPDSTKTFEMPLTGLIGVEGAVGVFLDPALTNSANVGGFTATAPAPTN
ncbi:MAG: hypothetical protein ACNYPD_05135 [Candidatus Halichondribacter symbioticus]